jgi:hypothetical protein
MSKVAARSALTIVLQGRARPARCRVSAGAALAGVADGKRTPSGFGLGVDIQGELTGSTVGCCHTRSIMC